MRTDVAAPDGERVTGSDAAHVLRRMIAAFATGRTHDCHEYISPSYFDYKGRRGPSAVRMDSSTSFAQLIGLPRPTSR